MSDFEIGFVVGVLAAIFVYCCWRVWVLWETDQIVAPYPEEEETSGQLVVTRVDEDTKTIYISPPQPAFDVSQRQSWRQRRRELTEAARSKRKKLESFQEFV